MKLLKLAAVSADGLVGTAVIAAVVLYFVGGARLARIYDISVEALEVPADEAAIARGRHLAEAVTLCHACHGDNLEGQVIFDDPTIATVYASNLTAGRGGTGGDYRDDDYVRAIRHGVNREGRGLMIMHSDAYHHLSPQDLGAIIAYIKSLPPVDNEVPGTRGAPLGKVLIALGLFDTESMPLIPAEKINHEASFMEAPLPGPTPDYGRYLVSIAVCSICHGGDLTGGPPIEEGAPAGPNIRVLAQSGAWSKEEFLSTMRSGQTPYGKALNPEFMPWKVYSRMTDEELAAIWRYLVSG